MINTMDMIVGSAKIYVGDFSANYKKPNALIASLGAENEFGLCKDGVKIKSEANIAEYDFNGKNDKTVKEMQEILGYTVEIEGELIDINETFLSMSGFKKETIEETGDYKIYNPSALNDTDYKDIVIVGRLLGKDTVCAILCKNCYNSNGIEFDTKDKENAGAKFKFNSCYSIEDMDATPISIIM